MSERRAFSVAVFARHRGRTLLIRHRRLGTWLPVGGEIEPGETPMQAALRELHEETGLHGVLPVRAHAIDGEPPGLIGYEEHLAGSKGRHLNFVFVADVDTDRIVPNDEVLEHRWVIGEDEVPCPLNVSQLLVRCHERSTAELIEEWLAAYNARDLSRLLALFHHDAVHVSPKIPARELRGKAALTEWWSRAMERLPELHYRKVALSVQGERGVLQYVRENPGDAPLEVAQVFTRRGALLASSHVFHG